MKVIRKKSDDMMLFSDIGIGDVFEFQNEVLMKIYNKQVVILKSHKSNCGDYYGETSPIFIKDNPQVKKLKVHLVIEND